MSDEGKFVYSFSEGTKEMKDLLGGKGSGLAAMSILGLPVPPGFTITTEACRAYMEAGELPNGLMESVAEYLEKYASRQVCNSHRVVLSASLL